MKDCKGRSLNIGDSVVYVHGKNAGAYLKTGDVTKFYKTRSGEDECSVGNAAHIKPSRVMKLGG